MKTLRGPHRSKAVAVEAARINISQRVASLIKGKEVPRHNFNGKNRKRNGKVVAVVGGRWNVSHKGNLGERVVRKKRMRGASGHIMWIVHPLGSLWQKDLSKIQLTNILKLNKQKGDQEERWVSQKMGGKVKDNNSNNLLTLNLKKKMKEDKDVDSRIEGEDQLNLMIWGTTLPIM